MSTDERVYADCIPIHLCVDCSATLKRLFLGDTIAWVVMVAAVGLMTMACGRVGYDPATGINRGNLCGTETVEYDDGNDIAGDGCTNCRIDPGWGCSGAPSVCTFCDMTIDSQTVALYSFDGVGGQTIIPDITGGHDGQFENGLPLVAAGPEGCGDALQFNDTDAPARFVKVDASPDFQLEQGAVTFRVQFHGSPSNSQTQAMMSRDATLTDRGGHLRIARGCGNYVQVRLQGTMDEQVLLCSDQPIASDTWAYVEVNFGGGELLTLRIDGVPQNGGPVADCPNSDRCGVPIILGIDDNTNPWVFGASSSNSNNNSTNVITSPFDGLLDHLRIRSERTDL